MERSHLWDSWVVFDERDRVFHRFVLSAPKSASLVSTPTEMSERDRLAQIRHMASFDGAAWEDLGDTRISGWSGSAVIHRDQLHLFFTGKGREQRLCTAVDRGDGDGLGAATTILDPREPRIRDAAIELGYHLESGDGYIPAWRDPHVTINDRGIWDMLFAAKAETDAVVPAIGRAHSDNGADWTLESPLVLSFGGSPLKGQIELPVAFDRRSDHYIAVSHSWFESDGVQREVRIARQEDGDWVAADGDDGVILDRHSNLYGLNVCAAPQRDGEVLAYAFYWSGPQRMTLTPLVAMEWRGRAPQLSFAKAT